MSCTNLIFFFVCVPKGKNFYWVLIWFRGELTAELLVMQSNVNALIDMKLEKHKNLREESGFYWREIHDGTIKFDRKESEV
jgi:hypothetical protein